MYASNYVFGKGFFIAWVVVAIVWMWITMLIAGFYPIIDGIGQIRAFFTKGDDVIAARGIVHSEGDITAGGKTIEPKTAELSSSSGAVSIDDA